jgi:hypothetical protein
MRLNLTPLASMATNSLLPASFEVKKMAAMNTMSGKIIDIMKGTNPK